MRPTLLSYADLQALIQQYPSLESLLKRMFFAGAKCIVALAGDAIAPQYPGDNYHVKGMVAELARVDQALGQLPPGERLALLLVGVEGFDHEEACREMAVTATHLRVLLHRGRHHLRRLLEREL